MTDLRLSELIFLAIGHTALGFIIGLGFAF